MPNGGYAAAIWERYQAIVPGGEAGDVHLPACRKGVLNCRAKLSSAQSFRFFMRAVIPGDFAKCIANDRSGSRMGSTSI